MKKLYFALMLALGTVVVSCDMDKEPFGALNENTAIQSMNDVHRLRNNMYTSLRSMTTGGWVARPEIQMDMFHGIINNGNREGSFSNALIHSSDSEVEGYWSSCYSVIANANYLINKITDKARREKPPEPEKTRDTVPRGRSVDELMERLSLLKN